MNDESIAVELPASGLKRSIKYLSTSEIGATKNGLHAVCPCCGWRFGIDRKGAAASILRRVHANLQRKVADRTRHWLTNAWRYKTWDRVRRTHSVRSDSIAHVYNSSVGPALRMVYKEAMRQGEHPYFVVLWHDVPMYTENFFACKIGDLFTVLQGIADDSPEFAQRLVDAGTNALRRDGSALAHRVVPLDPKLAGHGREDGEEILPDDSSIRL